MLNRSSPSQLVIIFVGKRIVTVYVRLTLLLMVCSCCASMVLLVVGLLRVWSEAVLMLLVLLLFMPVWWLVLFGSARDLVISIRYRDWL